MRAPRTWLLVDGLAWRLGFIRKAVGLDQEREIIELERSVAQASRRAADAERRAKSAERRAQAAAAAAAAAIHPEGWDRRPTLTMDLGRPAFPL